MTLARSSVCERSHKTQNPLYFQTDGCALKTRPGCERARRGEEEKKFTNIVNFDDFKRILSECIGRVRVKCA
jgi:hypothetical protein